MEVHFLTDYTWVNVSFNGASNRKGQGCLVQELITPQHGSDHYSTYFKYNQEMLDYFNNNGYSVRDFSGSCYSDFVPFDIDNKNISMALDATRNLIMIHNSMGVNISNFRFYYSGSKGFHMEIPSLMFGITPCHDLPARYKIMAAGFNIENLDMGIYDKTRLWRIPNTLNSKSNRYKIPLTYTEIMELTAYQIKDLAVNPRNIDFVDWNDVLPDEALKDLYESSLSENEHIFFENGIPEGSRNTTLFKRACALVGKGESKESVLSSITELNKSCVPPLKDRDIKSVVDSACKYPPNKKGGYSLTDFGNAEMLADLLRNKYVWIPERGHWYRFNGQVCIQDFDFKLLDDIKLCIRQKLKEASMIDDDYQRQKLIKHLIASEGLGRVRAAIEIMKSQSMTKSINDFDTNQWVINCQNGVLNLKTGELLPNDLNHTRIVSVNYNSGAKAPFFQNFLNEIMLGDTHKINYIQKLLGYCLTGSIREECLYICLGNGGNGKTKLFECIKEILNDYCIMASPDILMTREKTTIPNDIARLKGARMILMSEPDTAKKFSDNAIKSLTGGDCVQARFLNQEFFEFYMAGKLILLTNHEIGIRSTDDGTWRRPIVIPFNFKVPDEKKDMDLAEKLRQEAEGIFRWMVEGCMNYQKEGLLLPKELLQAKKDYRESQDAIGAFLVERCVEDQRYLVNATTLYREYVSWAQDTGEYYSNQRVFGIRLKEKGYSKKRTAFGIKYIGLQVIEKEIEDNFDEKKVFG